MFVIENYLPPYVSRADVNSSVLVLFFERDTMKCKWYKFPKNCRTYKYSKELCKNCPANESGMGRRVKNQ